MSNVIPLRKCTCGHAGVLVDLEWQGTVVGEFVACADCIGETRAAFDAGRPVFEKLLRMGVGRGPANAMMLALFDHPDFDPCAIKGT